MKLIYGFIFRNGRFWWGKVAASTIIGAIAFGAGAGRSELAGEWVLFAEIGAGLGFLAALFLIAKDISEGIDIDDETGTPVRVPPAWGRALMNVAVVGGLAVLMVVLWIVGGAMSKAGK